MPIVYETTDYSQFKLLPYNRPINQKFLEKLKRAIKKSNKLSSNAILVTKDKEIIEGQHRWVAAKDLKLNLYYSIDENFVQSDIISLNSFRLNWKLKDYVNYYDLNNNVDFRFFNEMFDRCREYGAPFTTIYTIIGFLNGGQRYLPNSIRDGSLTITNKTSIIDFIEIAMPFCHVMNGLMKNAKSKKSTVLFFKNAYIRSLLYCYKKLNKKDFFDLMQYIKRDYLKYTDTNEISDVMFFFESSYNKNKNSKYHKKFSLPIEDDYNENVE